MNWRKRLSQALHIHLEGKTPNSNAHSRGRPRAGGPVLAGELLPRPDQPAPPPTPSPPPHRAHTLRKHKDGPLPRHTPNKPPCGRRPLTKPKGVSLNFPSSTLDEARQQWSERNPPPNTDLTPNPTIARTPSGRGGTRRIFPPVERRPPPPPFFRRLSFHSPTRYPQQFTTRPAPQKRLGNSLFNQARVGRLISGETGAFWGWQLSTRERPA